MMLLMGTLFTFKSFGQIKDEKTITRIINDNITDTYKMPVSQKIILFSVYLYVSGDGRVDSVGYSNTIGEVPLEKVINKSRMSDHLKKRSELFVNSKNSVIICPYMIWYLDNISAKHINELLYDFTNLFPKPEYVGKRKIIINKPQSISIVEPQY